MTDIDRLTPGDLAAIRARTDAASEGSWDYLWFKGEHGGWRPTAHGGDPAPAGLWREGGRITGEDDFTIYTSEDQPFTDDDAEFIRRARTDIPALLDHVTEQDRLIEQARGIACQLQQENAELLAGEPLIDLEYLERVTAERDELRTALQVIKTEYGQVCENYEVCQHAACQSSYAAWNVADCSLTSEPVPARRDGAEYIDSIRAEAAAAIDTDEGPPGITVIGGAG